jgi:hypothetical protein
MDNSVTLKTGKDNPIDRWNDAEKYINELYDRAKAAGLLDRTKDLDMMIFFLELRLALSRQHPGRPKPDLAAVRAFLNSKRELLKEMKKGGG